MTNIACVVSSVACLIVAGSTVVGIDSRAQTLTGSSGAGQMVTRKVFRTPWGEPDLRGIWTTDDMRGVPMQRPVQYGNRRLLTDEEFAERVARNEESRDKEHTRDGGFHDDVGTRTFRQTSLVVEPDDGQIPALTAAAEAQAATVASARRSAPASWLDRSLYDRCITRGVVGSILPAPYGNDSEIFQIPGFVVIIYEMVHETRVIPLDARPHVGAGIRLYMGDSRGRWEGDTLVVDTTNFTNKTSVSGNGGGVPNSAALHLQERFTRIDDHTIQYQVRIDDPLTYTKPWAIELPITSQPGYKYMPYECHEGNYAIRNTLSAARAEDREAEEAARKGLPTPPPTPWVDASLTTGVFGPPTSAPRDPSKSVPQGGVGR